MKNTKIIKNSGLLLCILILSLAIFSCSDDSNSDNQNTTDGDESEQEVDAEVDEQVEQEAETRTVPFEPPQIAEPYVDVPFLQEINHTTNEIEEGIGALVSVVFPPKNFDKFDNPTQITPLGIVYHNDKDELQFAQIDDSDEPLIAASVNEQKIVLVSSNAVYSVDKDFNLVKTEAPKSIVISGVYAGKSQFYIMTNKGVGLHSNDNKTLWPDTDTAANFAMETDTNIIVGTDTFVAAYKIPTTTDLGDASWKFDDKSGLKTGKVVSVVTDVILPEALDFVIVGENALQGIRSGAFVDVAKFASDSVPLADPRMAAKASDGGFIVATSGGAYRIMDRGWDPEWRVYNYERWIPSEDVKAVLTDKSAKDAPIYFATAGGMSYVTAEWMTIEKKMEHFVDRILKRHDRDGAVADSRMSKKGDLSTSIPWDSDNDGGWTCYWVLSECYRYLVTGAEDAKKNFNKSLDRMLSFQTLTGTEYFMARAVIRKEGCQLDDCDKPDDGEWFTSPVDSGWWVKADTSNDEVTSHMFMMGHAHDMCADEDQKAKIVQHVDRIIGGIVDHGYQLYDVDGEATRYGQLDPDYVNSPLGGMAADGGRRSAQMIADINLAYYLTGKQKYLDAKKDLLENHHYGENIVTESEAPLRRGSGDGDELATQAFYVLLGYEQDPALYEKWMEGWNKSYGNMRLQQAALWDMVNAALGGKDPDMKYAARWLQLAPYDFIRWNQHNSHRKDLAKPPEYYKQTGGVRSDGFILPYDERRCARWNTDQYSIDGGMDGMKEMDGADALMPYWLGRYYGFIKANE